MTNSLRTYRPLRILLASVLLFSIAAPLVQYACAMTGASVVTTEAASMERGCMDSVAGHGLAEALCPDAAPCASSDECHHDAEDGQANAQREAVEPCCCTTETADVEYMTSVHESALAAASVFLPLVAVLSEGDVASSVRPPPLEEFSPLGTAPDGVSLRVLHASFLL